MQLFTINVNHVMIRLTVFLMVVAFVVLPNHSVADGVNFDFDAMEFVYEKKQMEEGMSLLVNALALQNSDEKTDKLTKARDAFRASYEQTNSAKARYYWLYAKKRCCNRDKSEALIGTDSHANETSQYPNLPANISVKAADFPLFPIDCYQECTGIFAELLRTLDSENRDHFYDLRQTAKVAEEVTICEMGITEQCYRKLYSNKQLVDVFIAEQNLVLVIQVFKDTDSIYHKKGFEVMAALVRPDVQKVTTLFSAYHRTLYEYDPDLQQALADSISVQFESWRHKIAMENQ